MGVKKAADAFLVAQPLDWVIVRPGALTDEPGSGLVHAGPALVADSVSRDNVAAFLAAALHESRLSHSIVEVTDGSTPVAQAIQDILRVHDR